MDNTCFLKGVWTKPHVPILFLIQVPLPLWEEHKALSDYHSASTWNFSCLPFALPDSVLVTMNFIHSPLFSNTFDCMVWGLKDNEAFKVRS